MDKIQTLKGFRDFLPVEARKRQFVIEKLRTAFESYGFELLETPTLEYEEILTGKYGNEGDKLMYRFEDNGGRRVAMRYDQTVPLARVIAQYQNELPVPFKRYQIQNVWRGDNTQRGRFREFIHCDIDTVGTNSFFADAEIIVTLANSLDKLGLKNYKILINDRNVFKDLSIESITAVDKLKKIGEEGVIEEFTSQGNTQENAREIINKLKNSKIPESINLILALTKDLGLEESKISFSPTLARGLDYYTGSVFEIEVDGYDAGSIAGGGRYDNLIGVFAGRQIPAVGAAIGFDRLVDVMDAQNLFPTDLSTTKVLVTIPSFDFAQKATTTAAFIRQEKINTEIYLDIEVPLDKQLKYADKKKIPFVILFDGDKTILKDMKTGDKKDISLEQLPDALN